MAKDWSTDSRRMELVDPSTICRTKPGQLQTFTQAFRAVALNNGHQESVVCDRRRPTAMAPLMLGMENSYEDTPSIADREISHTLPNK